MMIGEKCLLNNMNKNQECPLFDWCPSKTAACRCLLPDDSCYWYRWFKKLIENNNLERPVQKEEQ